MENKSRILQKLIDSYLNERDDIPDKAILTEKIYETVRADFKTILVNEIRDEQEIIQRKATENFLKEEEKKRKSESLVTFISTVVIAIAAGLFVNQVTNIIEYYKVANGKEPQFLTWIIICISLLSITLGLLVIFKPLFRLLHVQRIQSKKNA